MNLDEVLDKRRALRSLDKVEISDEDIYKLAQAASLAPSCFNNQPWNYIFVRDQQLIDQIVESMPQGNQIWAQNASMIIGVFARKDDDCTLGDREYYLFDTGLATQNILLKATEMGLVAHPIAGYDKKKSMEIMKISHDYNLITLLVVGKKAKQIYQNLSDKQQVTEEKRPSRKDLEEFVYFDKYEE
ncbi:MAG: nitroreductase family protein [Candidatus Marinimicrobia bacterium]|nr:nitroreductase family protein [Candidatus Neomarinimicrobiota bacterium]